MEKTETTEEKLKKTQLAYDMALEVSNFKGGFLARAAHELRSPLSSLISLHSLILSDLCENPQEEREYIAQAYDSAKKLLGLLDQIVAVSKLDSCGNQLQHEAIALGEIFEEVYSLTYLQAANYNLRLDFCFPEPEIYVESDYTWLRQVLVMLIEGGVSFSETGVIKVFGEVSSGGGLAKINLDIPCLLSIENEPLDLLQLTSTDRAQARGCFSMGMTLLLCQQVLELMRGSFEIILLPTTTTRLRCGIPLWSCEHQNR